MTEGEIKKLIIDTVNGVFPDSKRIMYGGTVRDIDDPLNVGRIRVLPDPPENVPQILKAYENVKDTTGNSVLNDTDDDVNEKAKFTDNDPFVYIPLLPLYVNITPSVGEYVHIIYMDIQNNPKRRNQFYIPGPKASPMNLQREVSLVSKSLMGEGMNFAKPLEIKDKNGSFKQGLSKGVFAELGDVGIYSKGRSDLILKDSEILIRSAKTKELNQNKFPEVNEKRSFIQLSNFDLTTKTEPEITRKQTVLVKSFVTKLIEYDIENLDNQYDSFTGSISLYGLPNIPITQSINFNENTVIPPSFTTPIFYYQFIGLPMSSVTSLINTVIQGLNDGSISISGSTYEQPSDSSQFPFYFRPSKNINAYINNLSNYDSGIAANAKLNLVKLRTGVKFLGSVGLNGSGLVSDKGKMGLPFRQEETKFRYNSTKVGNNGYSVIGSEYVYILSHNTVIDGKQKVDLGKTTVYGLEEKNLSTTIKENTEGLVRGDSLKELLNSIVNFLISHGHPYHQLPPTPQGVDEITKNMAQFDTKIINQNIRIN
jgi:hypothetical protein